MFLVKLKQAFPVACGFCDWRDVGWCCWFSFGWHGLLLLLLLVSNNGGLSARGKGKCHTRRRSFGTCSG